MNSALVIDTPEGIRAFHMLAQYHALQLDILGIKVNPAQHQRGLAKHIRQTYRLKCKISKQATLAAFEIYLKERHIL